MQHRFVADGTVGQRKKLTPKEEVEQALYRNAKGIIYQPGESFRRAMMEAAKQFVMKGRATYSKAIGGGVTIEPYPVLKPQRYEQDARRVRIPATGGAIVRYRPIFPDWEIAFRLELLDEDIPLEVLRKILEAAGARIGVGDNRVNGFGRFEVASFAPSK